MFMAKEGRALSLRPPEKAASAAVARADGRASEAPAGLPVRIASLAVLLLRAFAIVLLLAPLAILAGLLLR